LATVDLQLGWLTTHHHHRDAFWIKLIENVDGFVTQDSSGNNVKIGSGQCYAVFNEKRALNKFSKEPLVIPLDKLANDGLGEESPTPTRGIIPGQKIPAKRRGAKFRWTLKSR
jgi:hypothetical protein